ncbi:MAG: flagellin [Rhodospirillaceae bacterium]|nr:flagellin [Rhodospirillaceae bacterium]
MPVISTNNAANAALNYLNQNSAKATNLLSQLASGSRIVNASDDAAGLAIGTQLKASVAVYQQASVNVRQGSSILQAADGALAQIGNVLERMLALSAQSASGQVTDAQRTADIQTEFTALQTEIDSIIKSTTYGGTQLLGTGTAALLTSTDFLVGTKSDHVLTVSLGDVDTASLGSAASVNNVSNAKAAMSTLTTAIETVTKMRAQVGAYQSQFNFANQVISTNVQNTQAASSVIMDADVASVKADLSSADVKVQAAVAALAQAAQLPQNLLKLIQS